MKTFVAHIIYRIHCEDVFTEQYDEQWRLIYAEDEHQALNEARNIARKEECNITDRHGRTLGWKLVAVKDIQMVAMHQGSLLFSRINEAEPIAAPVWAE